MIGHILFYISFWGLTGSAPVWDAHLVMRNKKASPLYDFSYGLLVRNHLRDLHLSVDILPIHMRTFSVLCQYDPRVCVPPIHPYYSGPLQDSFAIYTQSLARIAARHLVRKLDQWVESLVDRRRYLKRCLGLLAAHLFEKQELIDKNVFQSSVSLQVA